MSEERKANLVIAAENQTKGTLQEIKQDAANMAQSVEQSGKKAAKGLEGIGDGGEQAAKKLDRATRSIISSIQRTTAATEVGEKGNAKYFEALGKQRGVSGDVLEPYLAQLRKAELAQAASVKGMGSMEMSAKATAAAMRGVPAQFTDIMVSLQGGQAPLTVFLQQGGQLKDMFGGAGNAAKALSTYVLGLVSPFTAAAAAVGVLAVAYNQGSKEQEAFVRSIVLTGNASGVTASQLRDYAREIESITGTQYQAASGLAAFVAAGVRGSDELRRFAQTAIEWEKATGQAVEKTAEQFAALQKDPLAATLKLNDGTNYLTASVYEQIKALEEQGKKADAAKVAMDAYSDALDGRSTQIIASLGYLERGWDGVASAAKKAWNAMLNVGRASTPADALAEIRKELADLEKRSAGGYGGTGGGAATGRPNQQALQRIRERTETLRAQEKQLIENLGAEEKNAAAQAESARVTQAKTEFDKKYAAALQGEISLKDKLVRARKEAEAAGKSEADITKVLAYVTEEHNKSLKKGDSGRKSAESSYKTLMVAINQSVAASENELKVGEKLTDSQKLRLKYEQELATRKRAFTAQEKQNIEAGLLAAEAAEKQAAAYKELAKAWEDDAKAFDSHIKKQQAQVASINSTVDKLRLEEEGHMLAAAANISHAEAMERITIARLQEAEAQMLQGAGSQEEIERIQQEIAARQKLLGLLGQKEAREANKKAADDASKEWEKAAQTVGDTLQDYIMAGGKNGAEYLERLFATLILKPGVQYGANSMMGALGMGTAGDAVGSVLGGKNVGTTVLNNAGLIGAGAQAMWGASVGASSASLIGANAVGMVGGDALGALIAGNGAWAGVAVEAGATAGAAAGSAAAASGASGVLSTIGAAAPWIAGGLVALKLIGGMLGGGTSDYGAAAKYSGGAISDTGKAYTYAELTQSYAQGMQGSIDGLAQTVGTSLDALATMFGKQSGYSVQTGFTSDNDDPSRGIFIVQNPEGEDLKKWLHYRSGEFGQRATGYSYAKDPEKGYDDYLKSVAAATVPILKDIVPTWADGMLDGLVQQLGYSGDAKDWKSIQSGAGAMESLNAVIQQIAAAQAAIESIGKTIPMFANVSEDMMSQLMTAAGGSADALTGIIGGFYNSFTSEAQKMQDLSQRLQDAVGIDPRLGDEAAAQFEAVVKEAMAGGNAALALQLMQLGPTFKQAADYAQEQINSIEQASQQLSESTVSLLSRLPGGGQDARQMQAALLAQQAAQIWGLGAEQLEGIILQSSAADIEGYLREAWSYLDTTEAKQALVDLGGQLLEFASQAEQAKAQVLSGAWSNLGTVSGWAGQYLGDSSGLKAQLGVVQASYDAATTTAQRVAALQQIIALEGAISDIDSAARKAEIAAAQKSAQAAQEQLKSVQALLGAAQRLGEYADSLFTGSGSGLTDSERIELLAAQYSGLLARAQAGDADAMAKLTSTTGDYLSLAQQMAVSQADYSVLSGRIAAELAATAAISEASATSQADLLQAQFESAQANAQAAEQQLKVSQKTQELIGKLLEESMLSFVAEAESSAQLLASGQATAEALGSMPAELAGVIGATVVPAISSIAAQVGGLASAAMAAAAAAQSAAAARGVDGSHAGGLSYVPFDGYRAELHKGERVLTAAESRAFSVPAFAMPAQQSSVELEKKVERLESQMARVAAATERLVDITDRVTADGNANATEIMNVNELAKAIVEAMQ